MAQQDKVTSIGCTLQRPLPSDTLESLSDPGSCLPPKMLFYCASTQQPELQSTIAETEHVEVAYVVCAIDAAGGKDPWTEQSTNTRPASVNSFSEQSRRAERQRACHRHL